MSIRGCQVVHPLQKRFLLGLTILCLSGCPTREFPKQPIPEIDTRQLLRPVVIKIHHSSAVLRKSAGADFDGLTVACEAKDRFGDPVKALGIMRFELYSYARSQPANKGPRVGFWPGVHIDSLGAIQQYWDAVWGLYRFNLTWDRQVKPGERFVLEATLTTPEGQQLSDSRTLSVLR